MTRIWRLGCLVILCWCGLARPVAAQGDIDATSIYLWAGGSSRINVSTGSGAPSGTTTGDTYIDYANGDVYSRRSGAWSIVAQQDRLNIFTVQQEISASAPLHYFTATGEGTNLKTWRWAVVGQDFLLQTINDAKSSILASPLTINRSTNAMTILAGLTAGSGSVGIINSSGKIPAATSTYFASLDGSAWTNLTAGNLAGTITSSVQDNITRTGALGSGSITSGFGSIDVGADAITGGAITGTTGSFSSTLHAGGNFDVATSKFTVTAASGNTAIAGTLDQTGTATVHADVLPSVGYTSNLGSLTSKYLTVHAAELWVETLVAQQTMATIGGRILVAPTNLLSANLAPAGGTITVKYNNFANGDRIYLEANGSVEWMAVTSTAGGSAGAYTYTVTRNLDGSGADTWSAGDAIVDTGTTGNGFIDLFSTSGVLSGNGPTIIGNVRTGTTYNNIAARWAIGNLKSIYGYSATDVYGAAFGDASNTNITIDATNGIRIRSGTTDKFKADTSGNLSLTGDLAMSTSGVIRAGATAFGTTTGYWLSYNAGTPQFRIGNPSADYFQWDGSNVKLVSANLTIDNSGVTMAPTTTISGSRSYKFTVPNGFLGLAGYYDAGAPSRAVFVESDAAASGDTATASLVSLNNSASAQVSTQVDGTGQYITLSAATQVGVDTTRFQVGGQQWLTSTFSFYHAGNASGTIDAIADFAGNVMTIDASANAGATDRSGIWWEFSNSPGIAAGITTGRYGADWGTFIGFHTHPDNTSTLDDEPERMRIGLGVTIGSPTGGDKGAGTLNATAVYDDNVLLTDALYEEYYGAAVSDPTWRRGTRRLFTLEEVATSTAGEHRLPWMPTASEFQAERHVGGMITRLWQGQEQQQLYIQELEARIRALEQARGGLR